MKTRVLKTNVILLFAAALFVSGHQLEAQTTSFTYQGRLSDSSGPATGLYDFQFTVRDASTGGSGLGLFPISATLPVSNGLFVVTLDPGAGVFSGPNRWLEIAVRTNGAPTYTNLSPRQLITSAPYAVKAAGATIASSVTPGAVTAAGLAPGAVFELSTPSGSISNALQVDANGLVGIGTSAPQAGLQIVGGSSIQTLQILATLRDEVGGYTNLANLFGAAASGNLLATFANADSGITLVDTTSPQVPILLSQFRDVDGNFTNLQSPQCIAMKPNLLVVGSIPSGVGTVTLIDISNPANPVKLTELQDGVGGWNQLGGVFSLAISGNLLAISGFNDGAVTLADISNPAAPIKRVEIVDGSFGFTNLAAASGVAINGNLMAIGSYSDNAVTLVDITDPSNPVKITELRDGIGGYNNLMGVYNVALSTNGLLAIASVVDFGVTLVSVTNPASPVKLAEWQEGVNGVDSVAGVTRVVFSGNQMAASAFYDSAVTVFDISNLANPHITTVIRDGVAGFNDLGGASSVAFIGTNLAVTAASDSAVTLLGFSSATVGLASQNRVGIGTTQPKAALDVVGDVVVENANLFDINANQVELGVGATASGTRSFAAGLGASAIGLDSVAIGYGTVASNENSVAIGGSTVAGGQGATALGVNTKALGNYSTALGLFSRATGDISFAAGDGAEASGYVATAIGEGTIASGGYAVAMGYNTIATNNAMAIGTSAGALHDGAFVWADLHFIPFNSTSNNQFLIRAAGGVGINTNNPGTAALNVNGTIVAGNFVGSGSGITGLSVSNIGLSNVSSIVSFTNSANQFSGSFSGNGTNLTNVNATSLGGLNATNYWRVTGNNVASGQFLGSTNGQAVELRVNNLRALRLEPDFTGAGAPSIIGGSAKNFLAPNVAGAVIAGGGATNIGGNFANSNSISADFAFIGSGYSNSVQNLAAGSVIVGGNQNSIQANAFASAIGGGAQNAVHPGGYDSVIGGGFKNVIQSNSFSTVIAGGQENTVQPNTQLSTIAGGYQNTIQSNAIESVISGGANNTNLLSAQFATIPGGRNNSAASYAFAAGRNSQATNTGSFVWNDSVGTATASTNDNSVTMRASGGYRLISANSTVGVYLAPNSGSWTSLSDRNSKEGFAPVDANEVLQKVAALPLQTWRYKGQDESIRHLGPTSQDFRAAFGLGETERGITGVDADGVALAAIQGLNRKVEEKDAEIRALKVRLEAIERLLQPK